jgi:hypothetical protein
MKYRVYIPSEPTLVTINGQTRVAKNRAATPKEIEELKIKTSEDAKRLIRENKVSYLLNTETQKVIGRGSNAGVVALEGLEG